MKRYLVFLCGLIFFQSIATTASPIDLPKTGQTVSYALGDDGDIQAGVTWPSPRFTVNPDTTVTDELTGLIWAPDGNIMPVRDLGWDQDGTVDDGMVTWQHALDYVAKLNAENYLGYNDWRLPNVNELESLIHAAELSSAAWLNLQGFTSVQNGFYWSSTTYAVDTSWAWLVDMVGDLVLAFPNDTSFLYVWPVRGKLEEEPAPPRDGSGSGCFIATAAYGSRMAKEVDVLKKVRDEYLLTNELGRGFVSAYYRYSPRLADWVAKHPVMRRIVRIGLYPIVGLSKSFVGENASK